MRDDVISSSHPAPPAEPDERSIAIEKWQRVKREKPQYAELADRELSALGVAPPPKIGYGDAAATLATEAVVPFAHRYLMPFGTALGEMAAGGDFEKAFNESQAENVEHLRRTREEHPVMAVGSDVAGMLVSPVRGAGLVGRAAKATETAGKLAKVGARALAGAGTAALSTAETAHGAGASTGEAVKEGLAAAPAGALFFVPGLGKTPVGTVAKRVAAGAATNVVANRAGNAIREGDPGKLVEPPNESDARAAKWGGGFGLVGGMLAAGREQARNPNTQRGRDLRVLEESAGAEKKFPQEGDTGIDLAATEAGDNALKAVEARRQGFNKAFGRGEQQLLAKSAHVRVDSQPLIDEVDTWISNGTLSDGTPLGTAGVETLKAFKNDIAIPVYHPVTREVSWLPKDLTVQDLVKLRRSLDTHANQGKVAGADDVPYRALSGVLREEMIPQADPELAAFLREHHVNLKKAEAAHDALILKDEAGIMVGGEARQTHEERAAGRIFSYGQGGRGGKKRDDAINAVAAEFPETAQPIKTTRAVRAREQLAGRARQQGHGAQPVMVPGFIHRNRDAILEGAYGGSEKFDNSMIGPGFVEANMRAGREKTRKKKGN